ncbi:unnamed protein product [Adineta steineri]|uniref:G-protein coupled receptors family 1 profile domain-containing protein n=1 Tax=Adineta steineri TaxID=433720 RepID=A0A814WRN3_9BILA|nr:unnamed protein product [Adineta steineri]CAF1230348.1 unnamed protein product [Adineta steineri]
MLDITRVSQILLSMDSYMIIILYIIGSIGAILNIITFRQKQIRTNPCATYFLSSSIIDFCIMNTSILLNIIITFDKSLYNQIYSTRTWCKLGNYILLLLPCLSSSYIAFATVDRYFASSLNPTLRKCSSLKISRMIICIVLIIWVLFGIHIPIAYDYSPEKNECTVETNSATTFIIIDGFFFSLFNGVIVPFLLSLFGLLIFLNIKISRRRVHSQPENNHHPTSVVVSRQNTHMITMLLVQVSLTILLNTPYIVIYLLSFYKKLPADVLSVLLYIIFSYIARWFYYMNYCKTFYINTLASDLFRKSLYKQFTQFFRHHRII